MPNRATILHNVFHLTHILIFRSHQRNWPGAFIIYYSKLLVAWNAVSFDIRLVYHTCFVGIWLLLSCWAAWKHPLPHFLFTKTEFSVWHMLVWWTFQSAGLIFFILTTIVYNSKIDSTLVKANWIDPFAFLTLFSKSLPFPNFQLSSITSRTMVKTAKCCRIGSCTRNAL